MPDTVEQTRFSLDWLAGALREQTPQLAVCDHGHLRVRGNTCWTPVAFHQPGGALICELVEPHGPD